MNTLTNICLRHLELDRVLLGSRAYCGDGSREAEGFSSLCLFYIFPKLSKYVKFIFIHKD